MARDSLPAENYNTLLCILKSKYHLQKTKRSKFYKKQKKKIEVKKLGTLTLESLTDANCH